MEGCERHTGFHKRLFYFTGNLHLGPDLYQKRNFFADLAQKLLNK